MATATAEKNVEAKPRQGGGKNDARRLRQSGMIPAVVYGAGQDSQAHRRRSQADESHPAFGAGPQLDLRSQPRRQRRQGDDRGLAVRAHQERAAARRPEAHRHGQGAACQRADHAEGRSAGREGAGRHPRADSARGRNRVLAGRHSGPHRCRRQPVDVWPGRFAFPICRTAAS